MVKRTLFSMMAAALLLACSSEPRTIVVNNFADFDRKGEMVEVSLASTNCDFAGKSYVLKDKDGREVPYQLLDESLVFQADVLARSSSEYTLAEGKPAEVKAKVFARHVPERKDDFAWENDIAAYRMYGPALASENPSNGVDIWLKSTDELVVDQRYHDELVNGLSYHIDRGLGLDCYKVAHTLGAGGIAPYTDRLWVGNHYDKQEVLVAGPLRTVFRLTYDNVKAGEANYKQTITVTVDAGSLLNKAVVRLEGADADLKLAGGIFLHGTEAVDGVMRSDLENHFIAYAERATSDAGLPAGRNYVGVCMPGEDETDMALEDDHLLILSDYTPGHDFTYYFGGGWNEWKFPTDDDWFDAMAQFSKAAACPLSVSFK